jgi:hypothetical protein
MAEKLKTVGVYRILYAQPTPETGERVAVAILVQDDQKNLLYFDRRFPRLKKVFGDLELDALEFYLEDLKKALSHSDEAENVLNTYSPQIVPSDRRRIALPLDERGVHALMQKLLQPPAPLMSVAAEASSFDPVTKSIEAYVRMKARVTEDVHTGVTPDVIFGKRVFGLHAVALGVHKGSTWVLLDGVDLNELKPKAAIKRADEVGRNFWQLTREAERLPVTRIKRIGLILNGNSHRRGATLDAHDYSLHRLSADSDRTFDGSSAEAPELVRREILNAAME